MDDRTAIIVSAVRTPIGDFGGAFKEVKAGDLSAVVMKEAVKRVGLDPGMIDDIIWGCCIQDFDEPNVGRCGALKAGFPVEVPAYTIQRQCNSGMQAVINASMAVRLGEADITRKRTKPLHGR